MLTKVNVLTHTKSLLTYLWIQTMLIGKLLTVELVDPLHIKKCSEANAARRDELLTELDTKIKVSNATVFVEIEE